MKCSNCGKIFPYEKFYGICPKCGVYNRKQEDTPEEPQQEEKVSEGDAFHGEGPIYTYVEDGRALERNLPEYRERKSVKGVAFGIVCICLIVTSVIVMVCMDRATEAKIKKEVLLSEYEIEKVAYQNSFSIGPRTISVDEIRLLQPADTKPEFPDGEACIAIHVNVENTEEYPEYDNVLELPYLGYVNRAGNRVYKNTISTYEFGLYEEHYQMKMLQDYDYRYESSAEGNLIYFVDAAADSVTLCFEERSRKAGALEQLQKVYEIELPVPGEVEE